MDPNQQINYPSQPVNPPVVKASEDSKSSNKIWLLIGVVFIVVILLTGSGGYYLGNTKKPTQAISNNISPTPASESTPASNVNTQSTGEYVTAKNISPVDFDYPAGWHVSEFWPEKIENGVAVWINKEPNSNSPRGGPFADIEMSWKNGLLNAKEVFEKDKLTFQGDDKNMKEEIIKTSLGDAYHFTGVMPEGYMGGAEIDHYFLFIEGPDDVNDVIISIGAIGQPELKETLRHIVMSFKRRQ